MKLNQEMFETLLDVTDVNYTASQEVQEWKASQTGASQ